MNWYKENKDTWKEVIETVAAEEHRTTQMVEKDAVYSFVGNFCEKRGISLPIPFDAAVVNMKVQSLE